VKIMVLTTELNFNLRKSAAYLTRRRVCEMRFPALVPSLQSLKS
jgi:hypothetical protein